MIKSRFFCLRHIAIMFLLCLFLFITACQDSSDNNDPANKLDNSNKPDNPSGNTTENTWIEFKNLEEFPVTIYSDPARQVVLTEIPANGTKKVSAESSPMGRAFYPTFLLIYPIGTTGNVNIPYNGPSITAAILENKTNIISIPKLESITTNSAYIMLINNSSFSLTFNEGPLEKSPLGGGPSVINNGQNASYEITPKSVSSYSVLRNGSTPVAFPSDLSEFKTGIIYVLTYNGTALTLTSQNSILQKIPPDTPKNVKIEGISANSVQITWDDVYGATSYRVYRATGSATASYIQVANVTTLSWTDTNLSAGVIYYYKVGAASGFNMVSEQSAEVTATMPPANVRATTVTTSGVTLGWNAFNGASSYNVYRSDTESGTYTKINSTAISGTSFTDTNIISYTVYWYKVSTIIGVMEGLHSTPISVQTGVNVPGSGLAGKLSWLKNNAKSNTLYEISVDTDENIGPQNLSYNGKNGITIILNGSETMRSINLSTNGSLFTVDSGVTLILDNNITLKGNSNNSASLVGIVSDGAMIMNAGTKIIGNSNKINRSSDSVSSCGGVYISNGTFTMNGGEISGNSASAYASRNLGGSGYYTSNALSGGGVYISGGTFTMNGGKISGNTASSSSVVRNYDNYYAESDAGGGVYVSYETTSTFTMKGGEISGNHASVSVSAKAANSFAFSGGGVCGNFIMGGGVIYGNNAAMDLINTASNENTTKRGAAFCRTVQYGTFNGDTFYKSGDLTTTDTTIRVVNGDLLTE